MMPKWKIDHIKRFAGLRTPQRLSQDVNEDVDLIREICKLHSLGEAPQPPRTWLFEKVKHFKKEEPITRPPAVYDNKSWDDNINEILSK